MDATDAVLMPPPPTCPYGVRPRGQTPIYDQLRGERVNADVSTTGPDPQRVDHRGNHRLLTDAQVPAVVFGPPGPGADLAAGSPPRRPQPATTQPLQARRQVITVLIRTGTETVAGSRTEPRPRGAGRISLSVVQGRSRRLLFVRQTR
jgi:hypothetical protein